MKLIIFLYLSYKQSEFTDEMNDVKQRLHRGEHQNDDIIGALRELKTMISEIQKKSFKIKGSII